jgi:hypothetical protein
MSTLISGMVPVRSDPSEDVGLSPPVSSMDDDITVASSTHLSSGPPTRLSSPANNPLDHSSPPNLKPNPPALPLPINGRSAQSDAEFWLTKG